LEAVRHPIRKRSSDWRGSNNGSNLHVARNLFTYEDGLTWKRGRQQIELRGHGSNGSSRMKNIALSQFGQATFTSLQTFLQGTASTFLFDPASTAMNWRSLFGAFFTRKMWSVSTPS